MIYSKIFCYSFIAFIFASACNENILMKENPNLPPPKVEKIPYQHKIHGDIRVDNYYWLRDRDNPEVIDYLERENDYYDKLTIQSKSIQNELFYEMKSRIKEDDSSVPYFYNGYWYITRLETGKSYPIYVRKKDSLSAKEEILIDVNLEAKGYDYFSLVGINISPDNSKMSYAVDTQSRRKYTLYIKDLITNINLETKIKNCTGGSVWANDNKHLFYTKKDPETLRSNEVYRHNLETMFVNDELIYIEEDDTFSVGIGKSKSNEYIFISSYSTLTTEHQYLNANNPTESFKKIQERIRGLEYSVSHYNDYFYIITNHNNSYNFKLVKTPVDKTEIKNWTTIINHRKDVLLEDIELFENYWVTSERFKGLNQLIIHSWRDKSSYLLPVEGETYSLYSLYNPQFASSKLRYSYNSLSTPPLIMEFDMSSKENTILKTQKVLDKNFKTTNYIEKRIWAEASDGVKIPISLVYHKETKLSSETPLLQYAYGSYGITRDPYFSSSRLSLLDRGFIYAIAHVRGGEYLGRSWYKEGKLFKKKNTFSDFISCSKFLINNGYTSSKHLYAYGGSAGGLLMGVVVNDSPEIYNGVIAAVPFVDVITTMLDESIPLTTGEYDEWGNPNNKNFYDYMLSYSPYDQIKNQAYPNILVTTGLHDSQVQYWEPAKWVAKLRDYKTDSNVIFLHTNMSTGHGGASGRFDALKEIAKNYAFLLQLEEQID
ncbi:MAG: S9 family peptidase [Flavobacteriaceae bacterium]|nr:S9 family peptidase [Flavobacteriaceae bacterium]